MELLPEIFNRQSIRSFTSRPVEDDQIKRILEAGRIAPSAKNRQPWRFVVITEESLRNRITEAAFNQEHVGQAPVIIALCSTNIDYRMPNGQYSYPIDITFAASFMVLQAEHEGLGSCVITTFDEIEVKEMLTVPYSMKAVMLLLIGHPSEKTMKEQRKSLDRISAFNHW
jgi:nitroreductase